MFIFILSYSYPILVDFVHSIMRTVLRGSLRSVLMGQYQGGTTVPTSLYYDWSHLISLLSNGFV